ncbi:FKBP-type peptidylprolyl cis-trans isomerase [Heterostelium album PN500]|uniref:peptidylprolyl isomerase n=1 Tax=Heterostelium pallidum (strain ATCC 26659 / Pp 5 / PN500) TaxID=670386 RepID=D3BCH1_HETP5|nr:FKBP-type peptidylprolyl cis-trans isomerase [Heterostelium album PN500]EFA80961.1 FKBP-type peptidylprolyl cis-trans isomerase [Heterostelium album PN500]|eukprot:XP_020433079.1 FKBP-type peptidylprolyl cis-trans isomerase [Heterostelium album PN500]
MSKLILVLIALLSVSLVFAQDIEIRNSVLGENGCGEKKAAVGDRVSILYVGKLEDGTIFDASERHDNKPFDFIVGEGKVIPGMDRGVVGICEGETREFYIPYQLAYGEGGFQEVIPPKANLVFEVTAVAIEKLSEIPFIYRFIPTPETIGAFLIVGVFVTILRYVMQRFQPNSEIKKPRTKPEKKDKKEKTPKQN